MTSNSTPPAQQELSEGPLGIALLDIERGELADAHERLKHDAAGGISVGKNASLYHGAPAWELVLSQASPRGAQLLTELRRAVDRVVEDRLAVAHRRRAAEGLPPLAEFDLIRGLTGLGALLLARPVRSSSSSPTLLTDVLRYVASLATEVRTVSRRLPGWWTESGPGGEPKAGGHSNNGMAHGIAGPLSLLSLAAIRGSIHVPGQLEAIATFSSWLGTHGGSYWTTLDQIGAKSAEPPPARPSWCYGRPGIARARQLAAIALDDLSAQEAAEQGLIASLTDPVQRGLVLDATLCHGWAGLLSITQAAARDSRDPGQFTEVIEDLRERTSSGVDELIKPGFLEGRSGARLALESPPARGWQRALLID